MEKLKYLGIENFRIFKERTDFEFKKITLLVGANSTGKSSLSKALMLFKDSYVKNGLDFQKYENSFQTGGFENTLTWGSNKKHISFYDKLELRNYPTLGGKSFIYSKIEFDKYGFSSIKFYFNDQLLAQYNQDKKTEKPKFLFNAELFFEYINIPDHYKIIEFDVPIRNVVLFKDFQGEGKFGIVDPTQPSKVGVTLGDGLESYQSSQNFPFTPIYLSNNILELDAILDLYKNKYEGDKFIEVDLSFEIRGSDAYGNEWKDEETVKHPIVEVFNNIWPDQGAQRPTLSPVFIPPKPPTEVKEFLRGEFVDQKIFHNIFDSSLKSGQFANNWKALGESIEYHQNFTERIKRVYTLGDSSIADRELTKEAKEFIRKWCSSDGFDLGGEYNLEYNNEYATRSIMLGDKFLSSEGQGIGQLIILLTNICSKKEGNIILIEEPENHLHPSFQSKLADLFIDAQKEFKSQFIIETHSEYLIRRLQYLIAKEKYKAENAIIYNFRKAIEDNDEIVKRIRFKQNGFLTDSFYPGFFDESGILKIKLFEQN